MPASVVNVIVFPAIDLIVPTGRAAAGCGAASCAASPRKLVFPRASLSGAMPDAIDRAMAITPSRATAGFLSLCVRGIFDCLVFPEFALKCANLTAGSIQPVWSLIRRTGCQLMFQEIRCGKDSIEILANGLKFEVAGGPPCRTYGARHYPFADPALTDRANLWRASPTRSGQAGACLRAEGVLHPNWI